MFKEANGNDAVVDVSDVPVIASNKRDPVSEASLIGSGPVLWSPVLRQH